MMKCSLRQVDYYGIPPRTFAGLMELYECNYIKLRNLVPDLDAIPSALISRVPGALDLRLHIIERCKFTTTLNLTYHFQDAEGEFPAPDLQVRIYHDAQVGEVIACGRRRGQRHREYNRMHHNYTLEEKWRMNRFLQKWLGYCLMQGHRFNPKILTPITGETTQAVENSLLITES
ncbi:MAG: DUF1249 domain-containing protein [Gammaproteobacteria bacterium]|nr:DUF1249 domain-containing protein [Gammaproteobacteria bacterium]